MVRLQAGILEQTLSHDGSGLADEKARKRRSHKKSRLGCPNCKLRRVKCDEARPACKKCLSSDFVCNYDASIPDLQLCGGHETTTTTVTARTNHSSSSIRDIFSFNSAGGIRVPYVVADEGSSLTLDGESLERLTRFQNRTVTSLGTARTSEVYRSQMVKIACAHPFLMHVVQMLTAIHDRLLLPQPTEPTTGVPSSSPQTPLELHHWSRAAALFNRKLTSPLKSSDLDALWATGALLGVVAFVWTDATSPQDSWPLRPSHPSDLAWLKICEGKRLIWSMADGANPSGAFHSLSHPQNQDDNIFRPLEPLDLLAIPPALRDLYDVDMLSPARNPYLVPVCSLASLIGFECTRAVIPRFFTFLSHLNPRFVRLLEVRDHRALLLLAWWYALVVDAQWWTRPRPWLEGRAICIFLDGERGVDRRVRNLLEGVKERFGLV